MKNMRYLKDPICNSSLAFAGGLIADGSCMKSHTIAYSRGEVDKASP